MATCLMNVIEYLENPCGIRLRIFLQPKASRNQVIGVHNNELKIAITAPPVDGKANLLLLNLLSQLFKVPKSTIIIEKGELQRHKQVFIPKPKKIPPELLLLSKPTSG